MPRAKPLVLFACIHAVVVVGLFLYGFDLSAVDGVEPPKGEQMAMALADALMLPGRLLWTAWASKNLPNAFEWLLFVANSGLWGGVIASAVQRWKRHH